MVSRKSIQPKAALTCLSDTDSRETPLLSFNTEPLSLLFRKKRQFNGADAVSASYPVRETKVASLPCGWFVRFVLGSERWLPSVCCWSSPAWTRLLRCVEVFRADSRSGNERLPADVGTSCRLWLFHAGWRAEFCRLKCCIVLLIRLSQKRIQSCLPLFCFLVFVPTGAQPQWVCYQLRSVIAITLVTNMTHYHLSESSVCSRCFQCTKLNLIQSCRVCDEWLKRLLY